MSQRGLIFHEGEFEGLEQAMTVAATALRTRLIQSLDDVNAQTPSWAPESLSKNAQLKTDHDLREAATRVAAALEDLRSQVEQHRERCRDCEVKNVAIID